MPILHGMGQAADLWRTAVRRWWPESPNPEDAEPPMPHDTVFEREVPLYVDWDYWAKRWAGPTQSTNIWRFDNAHLPSELDRLRAEFHAVKDAAAKGLLCGRALETLHDIYSSTYINESTPAATVRALEDKLVAEPSLQLAVADAEIRSSPLLAPALYHFTTFPPDAA